MVNEVPYRVLLGISRALALDCACTRVEVLGKFLHKHGSRPVISQDTWGSRVHFCYPSRSEAAKEAMPEVSWRVLLWIIEAQGSSKLVVWSFESRGMYST